MFPLLHLIPLATDKLPLAECTMLWLMYLRRNKSVTINTYSRKEHILLYIVLRCYHNYFAKALSFLLSTLVVHGNGSCKCTTWISQELIFTMMMVDESGHWISLLHRLNRARSLPMFVGVSERNKVYVRDYHWISSG